MMTSNAVYLKKYIPFLVEHDFRVMVSLDDYGTGYVEALDDLTVVKPDKEPVLKPEEKKEH